MPTMAKLVGAILFAALAWGVSQLIIPLLPDGKPVQTFALVNAAWGLVCGWLIAGPRAGQGYSAAIGYGLTTSIAMLFWALFWHSAFQMVVASMARNHGPPMEAVMSTFQRFWDSLVLMSTPQIWGALLIGGSLAGMVVEYVGRRLP
ncbi:MAG: TrgA family protein [Limimaricola sp.]|uniref:TrgA family protein n=1 Tax=Limimaricola sp. TaxID=2211665 RepID=UPI001DD2E2A7|nr:TrgA family protein [Limimaricola sp.]MBI1416865.1 TrgA family protein [Limimaricola sp.]